MLPFASAACAEMLAERLGALVGVFLESDRAAFHIAVFLLCHLNIDNVARSHEWHENDTVFRFGYSHSLGRHISYLNIL